jgi:hypothetical protein
MKGSNRKGQGSHLSLAVLLLVILQLCLRPPDSFGAPSIASISPEERHLLGERMYREGILPSGGAMQVSVAGEPPVPGTTFTCAGCHLRSGLGSFDEGLYTPATNGARLFKPLQTRPERSGRERNRKDFLLPHSRPAYSEQTLAQALRKGVDPAGRMLNGSMPRFLLDDEDMAIMVSYLKSLSSQPSPGITAANIRVATVMTDDVSPEEREAMLVSLLGFTGSRNRQAKMLKQLSGSGKGNFNLMGGEMMTSFRQSISLSPWLLKGPPETWRSQLEEYYRKEPVFALVGGISKGEWQPIHQFSEDHHIPCLFPNTDFPVISKTDWYTLYLSKGFYQEGEAAARYLNGMRESLKNGAIVQIVRAGREGLALSRGFQQTWQELGHEVAVTLTLKPGEVLAREVVQRLLAEQKPAAVLLWDGEAGLPELETLGSGRERPQMVLVSSSYLGKSLWRLKEPLRDFTYVTYPFRLPGSPPDQLNPSNPPQGFAADTGKGTGQAYAIAQVLSMALMEMEDNYYRDTLLDLIGMAGDLDVPWYGRLSFAPGQRYASRGCSIVQLSPGEKPALVRKSEWVTD